MLDREQDVGVFIRKRRRDAGRTQRELAELAGVGVRLISDIERGKSTLRLDTVNAVLAVFGQTIGVVPTTRDEEPLR